MPSDKRNWKQKECRNEVAGNMVYISFNRCFSRKLFIFLRMKGQPVPGAIGG